MRLADGMVGDAGADYARLIRALARAQAATPTARLARALASTMGAGPVNEDDPGLYPDGQAFLSARPIDRPRAGREAARTIREPR